MTPREFLDLLWQYKPEEMYVLLWTLQDKKSHWFQDVGQAAEFAAPDFDSLFEGIRGMPWRELCAPRAAVTVNARSSPWHTKIAGSISEMRQ